MSGDDLVAPVARRMAIERGPSAGPRPRSAVTRIIVGIDDSGIDIDTKNTATECQSGDELRLDVIAAQHLPLFGGIAGSAPISFSTSRSPATAAAKPAL